MGESLAKNMLHTLKQFGLWLFCTYLLAGCLSFSPPLPTPTPTLAMPTLWPTATLGPTKAATPRLMIPPTLSAQSGYDAATFIKETYPDYSVLAPGKKFVKTWDIKNIGTSTWNTNYSLVVDAKPQNDSLGSPTRVSFPRDTPPGQTVTLAVSLTAPLMPGTYSVYWKLENDHGETFGVDRDRVWLTLMVCEAGKPCSPPVAGGSKTSNGVSLTLNNFKYDAQSATVDFCITLPNREYVLVPAPSLLIDDKLAPFLEGGSSNPWNCMKMKYQISVAELAQAQHITLSIGSIRMSFPPGDPDIACQAARLNLIEKYPGLDFQCHFSMAGYYTDLQLPDRMSAEQARQIIFDTIEGAIYGPWELNIK
jgi:hypothetical protein